ncbi:MAG: aminopeptidase [Kiritimatiellae bacterium]|nr:aminopeptidase [Kiritimatiellia bacterium]
MADKNVKGIAALTDEERASLDSYTKDYMRYLGISKTERRAYAEAVNLLKNAGFTEISEVSSLKAGDKVYRGYHGKTLMAAVVGKNPSATGIRVVGGHTDAPRLDLKPIPLYEKGGIVFLDTHMYGGIKKYQWLVRPLALYGVVVKKDGTTVDIAIGDKHGEPVFLISDILPHLGREQEAKNVSEFFPAENLDVIAATYPDHDAKENRVKTALLKILKEQYGIEEDDFLSAELEIVPAGSPREIGFDRSLIAGYGHDDRVCAYAGLHALLNLKGTPEKTAMVLLCDKEEIGSMGATGMQSSFFENSVAELIEREGGDTRNIVVRRALEKSTMLSADVTAASDPHFDELDSTGNAAVLHGGPAASKYTGGASKSGSSDARAEFVAEVRRILDGAGVTWQMAELGKAEKGGGGTIAQYMARFGMDVIDMGTPLLNMHAPCELASKLDCWNTMRAYKAYFED